MHQHRNLCAYVCAFLCFLAQLENAVGQLPVTQFRTLYPPVAGVGSTSTVEVLGGGPLEEVERLLFSHPGISANLQAGETQPVTGETQRAFGKFTLSIPADLPPGFYEAWAVGRHGASYPRTIWIPSRQVVAAPQPPNDAGPFPVLPFDGVVVDRFVNARIQRYELPLTAGQRVRIVALDGKLDSRALCNLRVLSPTGRLVAAGRSEGSAGATVELTAAEAGNHRIELRDGIYRGGEEFTYALYAEPADGPRLEPASAPASDKNQLVSTFKPAAGQQSPARQLAALPLLRWLNSEGGLVSLPAPRTEPLDITLPCCVTGTFSSQLTGETFQFTAKKGEVFQLDVASDCLGENSDALLSIYKVTPAEGGPKLARLTEQDDAPPAGTPPYRIVRRDPSLRWEVPEDATYRLAIRDQLATTPATAGRKFVLSIRKPQPALDIMAAWLYPIAAQAQARPIGNNLLPGGSAAIRILIGRAEGLTGPVEVRCEGLPPGIVAPAIVIPADREEGHLIISYPIAADPSAVKPPAGPVPLKIKGKVLNDAQPIEAEANAAALTWEGIPSWNALIGRLSQQLVLYVNELDTLPVTFNVGNDQPLVMARGGKLPVPITVARRPGGADKAVLRAQGLPTKTTLADVTIEGNVNESKPEIVIAADAPIGEASLWFQVETKVKFRNNPQAMQRVEATKAALEKIQADPARAAEKDAVAAALKAATDKINQLKDPTAEKDVAVFLPTNSVRIKIVPAPVEAAMAWRIEAKRGTESDHPLALKRLFGLDSPIDVKLEPASPGVELTAPAIATGAEQAQAHVKLAADAAPGERTVQLKLSYKFNNQDLSTTLPLTLVISE